MDGTWVSVEEQLPEEDRSKLLCYRTLANRRGVCLGKWVGVRWRMAGGYYLEREMVTHWMELPALPEALTPGASPPTEAVGWRGESRSAKHS